MKVRVPTRSNLLRAIDQLNRMQVNPDKRDIFISHSTEDKEAIARPLAEALHRKGFTIWFDEYEIKIGDSIRESIESGLAKSTYGVVILSPSYFERYWTNAELNAFAAREASGKKVILPVWFNVDRRFVTERSPMLADRLAARFSDGLDHIVEMISKEVCSSGTVISGIENILGQLNGQEMAVIQKRVEEQSFDSLKRDFRNVLSGIAFFGLTYANSKAVFDYIPKAILARPENEAKDLFACLLDWYIFNTTPNSHNTILATLLELIGLPFAKDVVAEKGLSNLFVLEFAQSDSWNTANITTEILVNILPLLTAEDKEKIVDAIAENSQIQSAYASRRYLEKFLILFQKNVHPAKLARAHKALS